MNILITGGAGFIGTKLSNKLIDDGHSVIVFDNLSSQVHEKKPIIKLGVKFIQGDVKNKKSLTDIFDAFNVDYVFHLASETGTNQSMNEIHKYTSTNVDGTAVLLDIINSKKYNVKKIILTSTRAVYGEKNMSSEEDEIFTPKSIYGLTKLMQENMIKMSSCIPYTIFRLQNVYGPGQSINNPYTGIIGIFSKNIYDDKPIEVFDEGLPTRDFVFIDDVVESLILGLSEKTNYKTYNVGSGIETKLIDVASIIKEKLNSSSTITKTSFHRDGDVIFACGNVNKIETELNWKHSTNINDGLTKYLEWFKEEYNDEQ